MVPFPEWVRRINTNKGYAVILGDCKSPDSDRVERRREPPVERGKQQTEEQARGPPLAGD